VAPLSLEDVINSVYQSYPLLESAYLENTVALGKQVAAWGEFDTKLKAGSENLPLGFYENYRQSAGFLRPLYGGGEVFGGYRVGRGVFQPWYLERQTNEGGEFKAGFVVPLVKNRPIDKRRAELWRASYERQRVRPEIRAQLLWFVRDARVTYWTWVAAGRRFQIGRRALELAQRRNSQLERRVAEGDEAPPVLQDNLRAIALRESKLIDLERKLLQSAVKLSLFYRTDQGDPQVPPQSRLASFAEPDEVQASLLDNGIQIALRQRPEIAALDALSRSVNVDLAEARNEGRPRLDAAFVASQDMGEPTSSKRDKSPLELETGLFFDVPVQRRKARGKMQAARAKLSQIAIKRRFTQDKIVTEVQAAYAALAATYERLGKAREGMRLAEYMASVERRKFQLGGSDLLSVVLREQNAIEAADGEVDALLEYFIAEADYDRALANDWLAQRE
jgi:outer membrane protein TolC